MAKGQFPKFVKQLSIELSKRWSAIHKLSIVIGPEMPKASTFYAGASNPFARHLFINIQHNPKPWAVGDCTVNIILSNHHGRPSKWLAFTEQFDQGAEGSFRLGGILYGKDKWWCLTPSENRYGITWHATSYQNEGTVFDEAIADIIHDLALLFERFNHHVA